MAIVRDPRTGQLIEVPDGQQPGTGAPRQPINVGRAIGDIGLGALSIPGAAIADLVGYRATQAVGGQVPAEPNPRLTAALQRVGTGVEQFGQANVDLFRGAQAAGRGLLGVQPAAAVAPLPTTQPAQPPAQPAVAQPVQVAPVPAAPPVTRPATVRGQSGAQGQAAAQRQAQATAAAGVGTGIGIGRQGGEIFRREGPGGVPEFFNEPAAGGTAVGAAPASAPTGFRSNTGQSAAEYLASARAQDQAELERRQRVSAEARAGLERAALQRATTQGTGDARLAARRNLAAFEAQQLQQTQEAGATARTGLEVAARQEQARQQAAANVLAAQAQAQGQLGAAQLRGQFGLQEAELTGQLGVEAATQRAAGAVQAAQAGVNPLNQQRALQLAARNERLRNLRAQGVDITDEQFLALTSTGGPGQEDALLDPIGGFRVTPALERLRQEEALRQAEARANR